jgi:hypothetical protein
MHELQASAFFRRRVPIEEGRLLAMFGQEYARYATRTPILIPGVHGYAPREVYAAAAGGSSRSGGGGAQSEESNARCASPLHCHQQRQQGEPSDAPLSSLLVAMPRHAQHSAFGTIEGCGRLAVFVVSTAPRERLRHADHCPILTAITSNAARDFQPWPKQTAAKTVALAIQGHSTTTLIESQVSLHHLLEVLHLR